MKQSLLYLLLVVLVAGWLGTLVARDPGYVLVSYDGTTIQTGLWVMLGFLVVAGLSIYYLMRFLNVVSGVTGRMKVLGKERKRTKAVQQTTRGLIYLQEGDFERAEKFLISGAKNHESPAINFIAAAKSANTRGDDELREAYLRQALETEPEVKQAVAIAASEMAADREDWKASLMLLRECKESQATLNLKKEALVHLDDWKMIEELMPRLKKFGSDVALDEIEKRMILNRLVADGGNDDELVSSFKKTSAAVRSDEEVVLAFCTAIQNEKEAEATARNFIKGSFSGPLVEAYGSLGAETLKRRIKTAEGWEKSHEGNASVSLCLGRLYEASGEREKAKQAYEKSIEGGNTTGASQQLANLLAFDGDFEKSNEYLRIALTE